jgi:hypothetical protein
MGMRRGVGMAVGTASIAIATALAVSVVSVSESAAATPKPSLKAMLRLAGIHVRQFEETFASVIGEENYEQLDELEQSTNRRSIHSDVLSIWIPDAHHWMWTRSVQSVDGKPVDSSRRLDDVVARGAPDLVQRLQAIRDEGARFNVGGTYRNFNDPTFALMFLDPDEQPRFKFQLAGTEKIESGDALKIRFSEQKKPTLVRDRSKDAPADGIVWLAASDGAVLRTRLTLRVSDVPPKDSGHVSFDGVVRVRAAITTRAAIDVDYHHDSRVESWVPTRMREQYGQFVGNRRIDQVTCTATYSQFRRFRTSARIVSDP